MWRYTIKVVSGASTWLRARDREEWLDQILSGAFSPKAPLSWIASQADIGRRPPAVYAIWAKYPVDRKYVIWSMADNTDARAAGYYVD